METVDSPNKKPTLVTLVLFLCFTLHTLVFGFAQHPDSFLSKEFDEYQVTLKVVFYVFAITIAHFHQPLIRCIGFKRVLIGGLVCNMAGLTCLFYHHFAEEPLRLILVFLSSFLLGISLLSVLNCLITFIVLEHPKRTVLAITGLFIFGNAGPLLSPILLRLISQYHTQNEAFWLLLLSLLFFIALIQWAIAEPPVQKHLEHLRSGTLIWKEMHRRLFLYSSALILYSVGETTFNLWGQIYAESLLGVSLAHLAVILFWSSMVVGQLLALAPLHYFDSFKIFYYLLATAIAGMLWLCANGSMSHIFGGMIVGGLGCAAIFPIILAMLEVEVIYMALISDYPDYLPLIETAISTMTGSYVLGIAIIDFSTLGPFTNPKTFFFMTPFFLAACGAVMYYLHRTRGKKMGSVDSFFYRK